MTDLRNAEARARDEYMAKGEGKDLPAKSNDCYPRNIAEVSFVAGWDAARTRIYEEDLRINKITVYPFKHHTYKGPAPIPKPVLAAD